MPLLFILAYKGKKFFIQNEVKIIENPNIVNHLGYEDTYLQKIDNHSIHSEKVRDYLVSLKDNFLSNIRETARQNFAERRKELQDNADKNVSVIKNMRR